MLRRNLSSRRQLMLVGFLITLAITTLGWPQSRLTRTKAAAPVKLLAAQPFSVAPVLADARQTGDGRVLMRWLGPVRPQVLGYNVYREARGRLTLITGSPVVGRSLQFRPVGTVPGPDIYAWWDAPGVGMGGVRYFIDELSLTGETQRFGPFSVNYGKVDLTASDNSTTLADLGVSANDNGVTTSPSGGAAQRPGLVKSSTEPARTGGTKGNLVPERTSDLNQQWQIAGGAALKIAVDHDGWQKIPLADMQAAGLTITNPQNYRLFADGVEQAIVANGDGSLEFYGRALNQPTSTTRIYYLVTGSHGTRVQQIGMGPFDANVAAGSYAATVERRDRIVRSGSLVNGPGNNWFGPVVGTAVAVKQSLPVTALDQGGPNGQLEVAIQGLTAVAHTVEVRLNGSLLGTINYNALGSGLGQFNVPLSMLQNGKNLVTLIGTLTSDISLMDYVRLTYTRHNVAVGNKIRYSLPAGQAVRVDGFTTPQIRVFDITDPVNPAELLVGTQADGAGGFAFTVPAGPARMLVAQSTASANTYFAKLSANVPSTLNAISNQADFVILTPPGWAATAEPLRALRQGQGLNTRIVDVEDVYDEFSYGVHDPQAIKDFLQRASTLWATPVHYVLLLGDAGADPRDYLGTGGFGVDLMPTMFVDSQFVEAPSDDFIVDFNADGIADISIGRLPAKTLTHANLLIAKVIQHDGMPVGNTVSRGGLMVSDSPIDYDFQSFTDQIRAHLPAAMNIQFISRDDGDSATVRAAIIASINSGKSIVNFMGHGNVTSWTGGPILTNTDPVNFTNANQLNLFVQLTCLNGSFTDVNSSCLAEEMMRSPNGGAVAVWASSGETFPDGQVNISMRFYDDIFGAVPMRLGDAVRDAKTATSDTDVRHLGILFGDPTIRFR
jgi:hypothetical protein